GAGYIIGSPAAEPAAVRLLYAPQKVQGARDGGVIGREAALRQKAETACADIGARRIKQRAMIGERNMVEVVMRVVGIERRPTAVAALHAEDPFGRPVDSRLVCGPVKAVERQCHGRGVVKIGVVRIGVLKGPAARSEPGASDRPVANPV